MERIVNRAYTHKSFGAIGAVTLVVDGDKWTLDGKELPESSVAYLMNFALQGLQDSYAGAETTEGANEKFAEKYGKLIEGTIGVRGGGSGVDERTRIARSVTKAAAKANMGSKSEDWATFTGLSDDEQNAKLDDWFASNEAELSPLVDKEIERRAAAAKDKAGLSKKVKFGM